MANRWYKRSVSYSVIFLVCLISTVTAIDLLLVGCAKMTFSEFTLKASKWLGFYPLIFGAWAGTVFGFRQRGIFGAHRSCLFLIISGLLANFAYLAIYANFLSDTSNTLDWVPTILLAIGFMLGDLLLPIRSINWRLEEGIKQPRFWRVLSKISLVVWALICVLCVVLQFAGQGIGWPDQYQVLVLPLLWTMLLFPVYLSTMFLLQNDEVDDTWGEVLRNYSNIATRKTRPTSSRKNVVEMPPSRLSPLPAILSGMMIGHFFSPPFVSWLLVRRHWTIELGWALGISFAIYVVVQVFLIKYSRNRPKLNSVAPAVFLTIGLIIGGSFWPTEPDKVIAGQTEASYGDQWCSLISAVPEQGTDIRQLCELLPLGQSLGCFADIKAQ